MVFWGWFGIAVGVLTIVDIIERAVEKSAPAVPLRVKAYIAVAFFLVAQIVAYRDLQQSGNSTVNERDQLRVRVVQLQTKLDDQQQQLAAKDRPVVLQMPAKPSERMAVLAWADPFPPDPNDFLIVGHPVQFNVGFKNVGQFQANNYHDAYEMELLDAPPLMADQVKATQANFKKLSAKVLHNKSGAVASPGDFRWNTVTLSPLSQDNRSAILESKKVIFILGFAYWEDSSGSQTLNECYFMQAPVQKNGNQPLIWHVCL
jgi:hypothetical protein